jgi:hypothetical protein
MLRYGSLSVRVSQTHEWDCAALSRKPVSVFLAEPEGHGILPCPVRLAAGIEAQDFLALLLADAKAITARVAWHDRSAFSKGGCLDRVRVDLVGFDQQIESAAVRTMQLPKIEFRPCRSRGRALRCGSTVAARAAAASLALVR